MITFLILTIVVLVAVIGYMNFTFKKMQELHIQKIEKLHLVILELSKNQRTSEQKIHLATEFQSHYTSSKMLLNNEILALQTEILAVLQKNNLIE